MRGEKSRPNDGYESVNLSPAEKAGLKPEDVVDLDVVLLKKKKSKNQEFAQGTDPSLKSPAPEDDFSDKPTKVYKRKTGQAVPEVSSKKPSFETRAALKEIKYKSPTQEALDDIRYRTPTEEALDLVRETAESYDDPEVVANREAGKAELAQAKQDLNKARQDFMDEAEEVNDIERIRDSIKYTAPSEKSEVKKLDQEIQQGFKKDTSKVDFKFKPEEKPARKEAKVEMDILDSFRKAAQDAVAKYIKLYIEYDPNAVNKLHDSVKRDPIAARNLTAKTPPPFKAFLTSRGRELKRAFTEMNEAVEDFEGELSKYKKTPVQELDEEIEAGFKK